MSEQKKDPPPENGQLADLYEKMSKALHESLEQAGTFTEEVFERALNDSQKWVSKMREHYGEDVTRVAGYIRRDWHEAIRHTRQQTRKSLDLDRIQAGILGFLFRFAKSAGEHLEAFANRLSDRLTYKTGEIAGAGRLECSKCGQVLTFEKATRIPPVL